MVDLSSLSREKSYPSVCFLIFEQEESGNHHLGFLLFHQFTFFIYFRMCVCFLILVCGKYYALLPIDLRLVITLFLLLVYNMVYSYSYFSIFLDMLIVEFFYMVSLEYLFHLPRAR